MLPPPRDCIAGCYSVGMWCDVICIQRKALVWSTQNGIQVFHIGIDPFRAGGERRETSPLKWVYLRLFADQKILVQDANGWDLSVRIKSARQLCYRATFKDGGFKQMSLLWDFINWSIFHLINEGVLFFSIHIRLALILFFSTAHLCIAASHDRIIWGFLFLFLNILCHNMSQKMSTTIFFGAKSDIITFLVFYPRNSLEDIQFTVTERSTKKKVTFF